MIIECEMMRGIETRKAYFTSKLTSIHQPEDVVSFIKQAYYKINNSMENYLKHGSNWHFHKALCITLKISKRNHFGGRGFMEIPAVLRSKYCIINIPNTDDQCFQ